MPLPAMPAIETPPTEARSAIMRAIGPKSIPEEMLCLCLMESGIAPDSRNDRSLPGSPDLVFKAEKLAVFVDGGWWHGRGRLPKSNREWWKEKFRRNAARDKRNVRDLKKAGWCVHRISAEFVKRNPLVAGLLIRGWLSGKFR